MAPDDLDPWSILSGPQQRPERAVARAVVDEQEAPIASVLLAHTAQTIEERGQPRFLVETGNDDGDGCDSGDHVVERRPLVSLSRTRKHRSCALACPTRARSSYRTRTPAAPRRGARSWPRRHRFHSSRTFRRDRC